MRIAIFGAAGKVGSSVVSEALSRGHEVTTVVRNPARIDKFPAAVITRVGDAANVKEVAAISVDHDVVINATRSATSDEQEVVATTQSLLEGVARTGARLLIVGGAASLVVPGSGGRTVIDDPKFLPATARPVGQASLAQYHVCLTETRVDWAYLSPPAELGPGERTGRYRLGRDELLLDSAGNSRLSLADIAVVLLDEAEQPKHHQVRFAAAY